MLVAADQRLKVNIADLKKDGIVIINTDAFTKRNIEKAGYESNPRGWRAR